ncbi:MAG: hypothetical protein AAFX55_04210 [Bacteroidota bacterium]
MSETDNPTEKKESLFVRAKKLPLFSRIILTMALSTIWIMIASNFELDIQTNWIISTELDSFGLIFN